MISLPDPHGPDTVRPPYDTMFEHQSYTQPLSARKSAENLPAWGQMQQGGYNQSKYYGMVKCIDDNVGKILDALRSEDLLEKTIVVFTADHGDLRGEHGRHNKGVPYEGSAKIPFVIYYADKIAAGTIVNQALGCVDFLPTILSLMNVPTSGLEEGRDASSLFLARPVEWNDIAFVRATGDEAGWLAAVTEQFKLVYSTSDDPWLFDLEKDPNELTNCFTQPAYRETVRELSTQLAEYGRKYKDPRAANANVQADLQWAIEGTGAYVSPRRAKPTVSSKPAKSPKRKARKQQP
jgi:uncharacterized sulfatase